jgi:ketosteroid isomerase-like protein
MSRIAMTAALLGLACLGVGAALAATPAALPAALPAAVIAQRAEAVRATERAFAKTMADRDFAAFSRFIAPDAVFLDGKDATRGAVAVNEAWRPLFKGAAAPFSWEPDQIEVLPSGQLALSSGPVRNARGETTGRFYSVWRRERDGQWRIVLDHGCDACKDCKG